MRMIDADALIAEYDKVHVGKAGGARKLMEDAPTIKPESNCSEFPNNWIPCTPETMPEDEYVLISKKPSKLSGSKWNVAIAIRTSDPRSRKIQWRDSGFGVIQDDKVLAWMPLPPAYKPEEESEWIKLKSKETQMETPE